MSEHQWDRAEGSPTSTSSANRTLEMWGKSMSPPKDAAALSLFLDRPADAEGIWKMQALPQNGSPPAFAPLPASTSSTVGNAQASLREASLRVDIVQSRSLPYNSLPYTLRARRVVCWASLHESLKWSNVPLLSHADTPVRETSVNDMSLKMHLRSPQHTTPAASHAHNFEFHDSFNFERLYTLPHERGNGDGTHDAGPRPLMVTLTHETVDLLLTLHDDSSSTKQRIGLIALRVSPGAAVDQWFNLLDEHGRLQSDEHGLVSALRVAIYFAQEPVHVDGAMSPPPLEQAAPRDVAAQQDAATRKPVAARKPVAVAPPSVPTGSQTQRIDAEALVGAASVGNEISLRPPLSRTSVREMAAGLSEHVLGLQAKVRRTMVTRWYSAMLIRFSRVLTNMQRLEVKSEVHAPIKPNSLPGGYTEVPGLTASTVNITPTSSTVNITPHRQHHVNITPTSSRVKISPHRAKASLRPAFPILKDAQESQDAPHPPQSPPSHEGGTSSGRAKEPKVVLTREARPLRVIDHSLRSSIRAQRADADHSQNAGASVDDTYTSWPVRSVITCSSGTIEKARGVDAHISMDIDASVSSSQHRQRAAESPAREGGPWTESKFIEAEAFAKLARRLKENHHHSQAHVYCSEAWHLLQQLNTEDAFRGGYNCIAHILSQVEGDAAMGESTAFLDASFNIEALKPTSSCSPIPRPNTTHMIHSRANDDKKTSSVKAPYVKTPSIDAQVIFAAEPLQLLEHAATSCGKDHCKHSLSPPSRSRLLGKNLLPHDTQHKLLPQDTQDDEVQGLWNKMNRAMLDISLEREDRGQARSRSPAKSPAHVSPAPEGARAMVFETVRKLPASEAAALMRQRLGEPEWSPEPQLRALERPLRSAERDRNLSVVSHDTLKDILKDRLKDRLTDTLNDSLHCTLGRPEGRNTKAYRAKASHAEAFSATPTQSRSKLMQLEEEVRLQMHMRGAERGGTRQSFEEGAQMRRNGQLGCEGQGCEGQGCEGHSTWYPPSFSKQAPIGWKTKADIQRTADTRHMSSEAPALTAARHGRSPALDKVPPCNSLQHTAPPPWCQVPAFVNLACSIPLFRVPARLSF